MSSLISVPPASICAQIEHKKLFSSYSQSDQGLILLIDDFPSPTRGKTKRSYTSASYDVLDTCLSFICPNSDCSPMLRRLPCVYGSQYSGSAHGKSFVGNHHSPTMLNFCIQNTNSKRQSNHHTQGDNFGL